MELNEKKVTQFLDDFLDGKIRMDLSTKSIPKTPVKITKINLKSYLK